MRLLIGILFIVIWLVAIYSYLDSGLGFGYKEIIGKPEQRAIVDKSVGDFAVKPAILSYKIIKKTAYV